MTNEELLKKLEKLPKIETNNLISTMNAINVDDLMSAVDRLNKVPDYNGLLKENQELKKQLEKLDKKLFFIRNELDMRQKSIDNKLNQQKDFIKYLEDEIENKRRKSTSLKAFERNVIPLKYALQKYKEIIGDVNNGRYT